MNQSEQVNDPSRVPDQDICGRCGHTALWHAMNGDKECQIFTGCDCFEFKLSPRSYAYDHELNRVKTFAKQYGWNPGFESFEYWLKRVVVSRYSIR